jgi:quinol monooxygenase YgiN
MKISRREALGIGAGFTVAGGVAAQEKGPMYGLIGKLKTVPGKRDELAAVLIEGTADMPGCLSYVVANDANDPDAIWVTEVWESEAAHRESLELPAVKEAIAKGRPLVLSFDQRYVTEPVGGHGIRGRG